MSAPGRRRVPAGASDAARRRALRLLPALVALSLGACAGHGPARPDAGGGPGASATAADDPLAPIGAAPVGRLVPLPTGNPLGVAEVRVIEAYRSAGGRDCRRVELPPRGQETRVVCRRADGRWSATRALVHSGLPRTGSGPRESVAARIGRRSVGVAAGATSGRAPAPLPAVAVATPTRGPRFERAAGIRPLREEREALAAAPAAAPRRERGGADDVRLADGSVRTRLAPGETLWDVAERVLGSGHRWPIIAEANGVREPARMPIGAVLIVPPRSASSA